MVGHRDADPFDTDIAHWINDYLPACVPNDDLPAFRVRRDMFTHGDLLVIGDVQLMTFTNGN
ncbi:hypothetical protein, partial [Photorhabdus sp. RM126S]|uniref:hypothetical protein n=1 Tax=Photorhabdus sp. RM126S TaxID=3342826 RepID=UPI0036DE4FB6